MIKFFEIIKKGLSIIISFFFKMSPITIENSDVINHPMNIHRILEDSGNIKAVVTFESERIDEYSLFLKKFSQNCLYTIRQEITEILYEPSIFKLIQETLLSSIGKYSNVQFTIFIDIYCLKTGLTSTSFIHNFNDNATISDIYDAKKVIDHLIFFFMNFLSEIYDPYHINIKSITINKRIKDSKLLKQRYKN